MDRSPLDLFSSHLSNLVFIYIFCLIFKKKLYALNYYLDWSNILSLSLLFALLVVSPFLHCCTCDGLMPFCKPTKKGRFFIARKLSIAIWSIKYNWQNASRTYQVGPVVPAPTALQMNTYMCFPLSVTHSHDGIFGL